MKFPTKRSAEHWNPIGFDNDSDESRGGALSGSSGLQGVGGLWELKGPQYVDVGSDTLGLLRLNDTVKLLTKHKLKEPKPLKSK